MYVCLGEQVISISCCCCYSWVPDWNASTGVAVVVVVVVEEEYVFNFLLHRNRVYRPLLYLCTWAHAKAVYFSLTIKRARGWEDSLYEAMRYIPRLLATVEALRSLYF